MRNDDNWRNINPSAKMRVASIGRQICRISNAVINLDPESNFAKELGTTEARVVNFMACQYPTPTTVRLILISAAPVPDDEDKRYTTMVLDMADFERVCQ